MKTSLFRRLVAVSGLTLVAAGSAGIGLLFPRTAQAGQATALPSIFQGASAQSTGITIGSWGSGSITEDQKTVYAGTESLRVVTHGQFQGASLRLAQPVDLGKFATQKTTYFQVALYVPTTGTAAGGGLPGTPGGNEFGSGPGFGVPGGGRGGKGGAPGSGGPGVSTGGTTKPKTIENLRMVLVRTTGKPMELLLPLNTAVLEGNWKLLNVPMNSLPGISPDNAKVSEIRVFGDNPGILYVGRIGLVADSTPIKVEPVVDMIVEAGKSYRYTASASGGATPLKYSWDWDNKDGIQEESIGRTVIHSYPHTGDFVGTLTVSDLYGNKAPVSVKFKVNVHQ